MKFFLSHSSSDKFYVRYLADKLGDRAVFDEYNFESGMNTLDEIFRTIEESDIFVLFISNRALNSEWVQREIVHGKALLDEGQLKRFLPILIDRTVGHSDPLIPEWIRLRYNLRLVAKPSVALRRLSTVFNQLALHRHPSLEARSRLFVGRNAELSEFERRIDDYTKPVPAAIIVSGIREVGRKTFLLRGLKKSNRIPEGYVPIVITLQPEDGIEGFITKLHDLGYYPDDLDLGSMGARPLDEKKALLTQLLVELYKQNEILLVDDWRCLVRVGGEVSDWFMEVCQAIPPNHIVLAIASAYRPKIPRHYAPSIFSLKLSELGHDERMGLLVRYLREVEGKFDIRPEDFASFKGVLNGYPEQAIFAGQLIAEEGLEAAKLQSSEIVEFAALKASVYVERYAVDEARSKFLEFLSWFEFVSLDLVKRLEAAVGQPLFEFVNELVNESICDLIGSSGEYVRLNDIIRDYVSRGSVRIPNEYSLAVADLAKEIFGDSDFTAYDYSEKYAAVRVALLEGKAVPDTMLIPAHFLGAIAHKYKTRQFVDAVELSERILRRGNLEPYIESQVRHYYCMALARTRDSRLLTEVQLVKGDEHNYILGFYYRTMGRYSDALGRYTSIRDGRWEENAKREMVLIYNVTEDYDSALKIARDAFRRYPADAVVVQGYFEGLLHSARDVGVLAEMNACLAAVDRIVGERAEEIATCMHGRHKYQVEGDVDGALAILDDGIARFSRSPYPALAKLEVGVSLKRTDLIDSTLKHLKSRDIGFGKVQITKAEILRMAIGGDKGKALMRIDSELSYIHPAARERFRTRVLSA